MNTKKDYIKKWCELALVKTKNINYNANSSYGLKHYCEDAIGTYVSNDEIIEVMKELGFITTNSKHINYHYNISKVVNRVIFSEKLANTYSDKCRAFSYNYKTIKL